MIKPIEFSLRVTDRSRIAQPLRICHRSVIMMDARTGDCDGNGICFPYDVLLDILRRLPRGAIAVCLCVCHAWRAIAHKLLLERYFPPCAFPGIFVTKFGCRSKSVFFAPLVERGQRLAATADEPSFQRPVFRHGWAKVHHSCNGLLLLNDWKGYYVCNPATVRCSAPLPCPPMPQTHHSGSMFLAFDPAVSLHYEVFFYQEWVDREQDVPEPPAWVDLHQPYLPRLFGEEQSSGEEDEQDGSMDMEQACLPKSFEKYSETYSSGLFGEDTGTNKDPFGSPNMLVEESLSARPEQLQEDALEQPKERMVPFTVYSSRTGQWENREFTAGHCAPGHLYDVVTTLPRRFAETVWSSEYWHGSLYMHCHNNVLMILRPSKGTYDLVDLPGEPCDANCRYPLPTNKSVLASYERGIHYVTINQLQLQVWMLIELADAQLGWTLSHEACLNPYSHMIDPLSIQPRVTWGVVESSDDELVCLFEDSCCGESICSEEDSQNDMTSEEDEDEDGDEAQELRSKSASKYSWNSNEDDIINPLDWQPCKIMGLHPHKHALILLLKSAVVEYHVDTSRMQYISRRLP